MDALLHVNVSRMLRTTEYCETNFENLFLKWMHVTAENCMAAALKNKKGSQ